MVGMTLRDAVNVKGFALLRDRLREANATNPEFEEQFARLRDVLQRLLARLEVEFGDEIDRVMAVGDWARDGIDLRNLPCDDIGILIVVRLPERPFDLYLRFADRVFADIGDDDILVQFGLETSAEWQAGAESARQRGAIEALGIPLLVHA